MTKKAEKTADIMTPSGFPEPPPSFDPAEKALWIKTVLSFPQDFFREADLPILAEFCRAIRACEMLAGRIGACCAVDELERYFALRDREARRAAALARTLRMPPQSRLDRQAVGVALRKNRNSWKPSPFDEFLQPARDSGD